MVSHARAIRHALPESKVIIQYQTYVRQYNNSPCLLTAKFSPQISGYRKVKCKSKRNLRQLAALMSSADAPAGVWGLPPTTRDGTAGAGMLCLLKFADAIFPVLAAKLFQLCVCDYIQQQWEQLLCSSVLES